MFYGNSPCFLFSLLRHSPGPSPGQRQLTQSGDKNQWEQKFRQFQWSAQAGYILIPCPSAAFCLVANGIGWNTCIRLPLAFPSCFITVPFTSLVSLFLPSRLEGSLLLRVAEAVHWDTRWEEELLAWAGRDPSWIRGGDDTLQRAVSCCDMSLGKTKGSVKWKILWTSSGMQNNIFLISDPRVSFVSTKVKG